MIATVLLTSLLQSDRALVHEIAMADVQHGTVRHQATWRAGRFVAHRTGLGTPRRVLD